MSDNTNTERFIGQVKFFNRDRGFGFVTRLSDNKDFFSHYQDIRTKSICRHFLVQGEYVEFSLRQGPGGEQASEVTGIQGGSLMCEHPPPRDNFNNKKRRKPIHNNTKDLPEAKRSDVDN